MFYKFLILILILPLSCHAETNQGFSQREPVTKIYTGDSRQEDDDIIYSVKNNLGNTQIEIDQNGEVYSETQSYPYGSELRSEGENDKVIANNERDEETGLDKFYARSYDSDTGRWASLDPMGESPYNYVVNNPTNRIDPTGMISADGTNAWLSMPEKQEYEPPQEQGLEDGGLDALFNTMILDPLMEAYSSISYKAYQSDNPILKSSTTALTGFLVMGVAFKSMKGGKIDKWKKNRDLWVTNDDTGINVTPDKASLMDYFLEKCCVKYERNFGDVLMFDMRTKMGNEGSVHYNIIKDLENVTEYAGRRENFLRYDPLPSGSEFFQESVNTMKFDSVEGLWLPYSDNHKMFWNNIMMGMTKEQAALNTWTGNQLPSEFKDVTFLKMSDYKINVRFTK